MKRRKGAAAEVVIFPKITAGSAVKNCRTVIKGFPGPLVVCYLTVGIGRGDCFG
ncbi:hypothetical protein HUE98_13035 [Candidatus Contubernalis alkalaceticus]|nr:hypothetical protein HUE98_13035 [Candidatus Contubernalis alkalaceticus]